MKKPSGGSASRPSALFVSPEPPFPIIGGGALRSASIFEYLQGRYRTDVITFRQPGAPDPRDRFPVGEARDIHVIDLPHHSKAPVARLGRNLNRALQGRPPLIDRFSGFEKEIAEAVSGQHYDVGVIEHFWCATYEAQLRSCCRRIILDLHNIESAWHAALAATESRATGLLYRRFADACRNLERELLPRFDQVLVTSGKDAARVGELCPDVTCCVYPNALPEIPRPSKAEREVIVFSGNLEYQPNISGIRYFRNEIWPTVRQSCPELIWEIIGKHPGAVTHCIDGDYRIRLVGEVEDAVPRIASAKVAIVPLLAGSGTRMKILEAWAAATAVVSTSIGAEGLEAVNGEHLIIADKAPDFASSVVRLVTHEPERVQIRDTGRGLFERSYTWPRAWETIEQCLT